MSKKTTRQPKPSAEEPKLDPMAEAERRIAEARRMNSAELHLIGLGLTEVPATLFELQQLQELNLRGNHLREVPDAIRKLRHLQSLNLGENQLEEVPAVLRELR